MAAREVSGRVPNIQHDAVDKHQSRIEDVEERFVFLQVIRIPLPDFDAPVDISDQDER